MTPKERAAMQQALEALENYGIEGTKSVGGIKCTESIAALREALAEQAEQEPVLWGDDGSGAYVNSDYTKGLVHGARLCAAAIRGRGEMTTWCVVAGNIDEHWDFCNIKKREIAQELADATLETINDVMYERAYVYVESAEMLRNISINRPQVQVLFVGTYRQRPDIDEIEIIAEQIKARNEK